MEIKPRMEGLEKHVCKHALAVLITYMGTRLEESLRDEKKSKRLDDYSNYL